MYDLFPVSEALVEQKARLRRQAYDARNAQENKDEVSRIIVERFVALPEYAAARTVMWYLDVRSEVRTRHQIDDALTSGKRIVVPYCTVDERGANKLGLWHLTRMDELVAGTWKILEPPRDRWGDPGKEVDPRQLDLVMAGSLVAVELYLWFRVLCWATSWATVVAGIRRDGWARQYKAEGLPAGQTMIARGEVI